MPLSPETLVTIVREARVERAKRRAMRAEAVAAEGRDLTWDEVVAWHERKPPKRCTHVGKLGTPDARPIPPGATARAMEFRDRRTGEVIKRVEFGADGKP